MKIEVKKRTWVLTDVHCAIFAYGILTTPYKEEIIESEDAVPHTSWEYAYIMSVMKTMMRFPNSTIEECQNTTSDGKQNTTYNVTKYVVSVIDVAGVECAVYTAPFKSLLQLNGCKTNKLLEMILLVNGSIKDIHYTVNADGIIEIKFNTAKTMYSIIDVASIIGVTSRTLYNWVDSGAVKHHRTETGRVYLTSDEVEKLRKDISAGTIQLKQRGRRRKKEEKKNE